MSELFWSELEPLLGWMHRQLRRLGVREMDLEDLAQEVCLRVFRSWEKRDPARPLKPWLFGFLFRVSSEYRKRSAYRRPHLPLEGNELSDRRDPQREIEAQEARCCLLRALDSLPQERRAVFVLVELEEYAVTEAAEILEIPVNTAYTRLRKARHEVTEAVLRERGSES